MKIIVCNVPLREVPSGYPPIGATNICDSLTDSGYNDVDFYNIDLLRPTENEIIDYFLGRGPDLIGISAVVSTSYSYVKWISHILKKHLPRVPLVLGGCLGASAEVVLRKCPIDICVIGEGEETIIRLCKYWKKYKKFIGNDSLTQIKGVVFKDPSEPQDLIFTGLPEKVPVEQLRDFNYDILGNYYITEPDQISGFRYDPRSRETHRKGKRAAYVLYSKGCVARCTFCHRWTKGYRSLPIDRIIERIKYLKEQRNIGFFLFAAESFGADRAHLEDFLYQVKPLDILWHVEGMRVKSVDENLLRKMKECGCSSVYFGIESGSDRMLKIMEKGASVYDNYKAIKAAKEVDLFTTLQLILGMPGENEGTIKETIKFVRKCNEFFGGVHASINYAQTLPGTPLYEYARLKGFIGKTVDEEEQYLLRISDTDAADLSQFINMTGEQMSDVIIWRDRINKECLNINDSRYKALLTFVYNYLGETVSKLFLKLIRCYQLGGSLRGAAKLLKIKNNIEPKLKPKSLRVTVKELSVWSELPNNPSNRSSAVSFLRESL